MKHYFIKTKMQLFVFLIFGVLSQGFAGKKPKIDPIRFTLTTEARNISLNEEFEIKITATFMSLNPNIIYVFPGANSFKLKLITPEGFKQTGGTFADYTETELSESKPTISYTVKGKFVSESDDRMFQLLRSHKNANEKSDFIMVSQLNFSTISSTKDSTGLEDARISVLIPHYIPYMTIAQFKLGAANSDTVIYLNEGKRSGIYHYDQTNTTASEDTSMVLVYSGKRYLRQYQFLRPEWFGADPTDAADDYVALQKTLNYASKIGGARVVLTNGIYTTSKTLVMKAISSSGSAYAYNLTIEGTGLEATLITGTSSFSGNLIEMTQGITSYQAGRNNSVLVKNLSLAANGASRCFYAEFIAGLRFENIYFKGGETWCLQIGNESTMTRNYGIWIKNCQFIGISKNSGLNEGLVQVYGGYFVSIDHMDSDGGTTGIHLINNASAVLTNNKIEGCKKYGIRITGAVGNGEHRISGNYLSCYGGLDWNGRFDGTAYGLSIEGGTIYNGANIITDNVFFVDAAKNFPVKMNYSSISGSVVQGGDAPSLITGVTSGATGYLQTIVAAENKILVKMVSTTAFLPTENFVQTATGGTGTLSSITPSVSYGLKADGLNGSVISSNQVDANPSYGFHVTGIGYSIIGNGIYAQTGLYVSGTSSIVGNNISSTGVATINNAAGNSSYASNVLRGASTIGLTKNNVFSDLQVSGQILTNSLPTSATGLASGSLWVDTANGNVIKRVP